MDAIYTYTDYAKDSRPRLQFPKRTGKRTSYAQWLSYQYGLHHDGALPAAGDRSAAGANIRQSWALAVAVPRMFYGRADKRVW